jgi:hypothetical protein
MNKFTNGLLLSFLETITGKLDSGNLRLSCLGIDVESLVNAYGFRIQFIRFHSLG